MAVSCIRSPIRVTVSRPVCRCLRHTFRRMGCSLFAECERALTQADEVTLRARRELISRVGNATPIPELVEMAATLVPVTYEQSGVWHACPYREWLIASEHDWRHIVNDQMWRMPAARQEVVAELRVLIEQGAVDASEVRWAMALRPYLWVSCAEEAMAAVLGEVC